MLIQIVGGWYFHYCRFRSMQLVVKLTFLKSISFPYKCEVSLISMLIYSYFNAQTVIPSAGYWSLYDRNFLSSRISRRRLTFGLNTTVMFPGSSWELVASIASWILRLGVAARVIFLGGVEATSSFIPSQSLDSQWFSLNTLPFWCIRLECLESTLGREQTSSYCSLAIAITSLLLMPSCCLIIFFCCE